MAPDGNDQVTVAVLKIELRHLDERAKDRHTETIRRWDKHEQEHEKDAVAFGKVSERVTDLELSRERQRERTGRMAKISAMMSAAVFGIGELARWVIARGSGP